MVFKLPKMVVMDNLQFEETGGIVTLKASMPGFDKPDQLVEGLVLKRVNDVDVPTLDTLKALFDESTTDDNSEDAGEVTLTFEEKPAVADSLPTAPGKRVSMGKKSALPPPPGTSKSPPEPVRKSGHAKSPSKAEDPQILEMRELLNLEGDAEDALLQRFLISSNYDVPQAVAEYNENNGKLPVQEIADPELEANSDIEYEVSIAEGKIGMIVENLAERTVVVEVKNEGEAKKAGVKEDSVLVSVNGVSVEHLTHRETLSMITDSRRPMKLRVRQLLEKEIEKLRGEANSHAEKKSSGMPNLRNDDDHHPFPRKVQPYFQTVFEGLSAEKRIGLCHKMLLIGDDESALMAASLSTPSSPPKDVPEPVPVKSLTVSDWPLGLSVAAVGGRATVSTVAEGSVGAELGLAEHHVLLSVAGVDVSADTVEEVVKYFNETTTSNDGGGEEDDDEVACPYTIPFNLMVQQWGGSGDAEAAEVAEKETEDEGYTVDRTVAVLTEEFQSFFARPQLDENDFITLLTDMGNLVVSEPEAASAGGEGTSVPSTPTAEEEDDKFANILKLLEQLSVVGAELQLSELWQTVVAYMGKVLEAIAAENRTGDNTHVVHVLRRLLESKAPRSKMAGCKLWAEVYERIRKTTEQNGENANTQLCLVQLRGLFDRICQPNQGDLQTVQKIFAAESLPSVAKAVGVKGLDWLMGNYTVLCKAKEDEIKRTMVFSSLLLLSEVRL
jgi:hypothetical protein